MKILSQIGIVLGVCLVGEWISAVLPFPFPASVIGMILLFLLLCTKCLEPWHIREKADFLQKNMAFFFIPAGVGIMAHFDVLRGRLLPFVTVCLITTVVTFAATAFSVMAVMRLQSRGKKGESR